MNPLSNMDHCDMKQIEEEMKDFPCAFTLKTPRSTTRDRFKSIRRNILQDLENSKNDTEEEINRNKNFLSWACFNLDDIKDAKRYNREVLESTQYKNIVALGNCVFIMLRRGKEPEAMECLQKLKKMKEDDQFDILVTDAKAEQAYYLLRMGGFVNLQLSTTILADAVAKRPGKYLWKFNLGLAYRRMTDPNVYSSTQESINVEDILQKASNILFDVGKNGEDKLQARAYAQLTCMRQYYDHTDYDALFCQQNVLELCAKALQYGIDDPDVLIHCGRSLKTIDVDMAIQLLLKGKALKDNSTVYHHLGLCYEIKANDTTKSKTTPNKRVNTATQRLKSQIRDVHFGEDDKLSNKHVDQRSDLDLLDCSIACYKKAEEVYHGENLAAIASLACLWKKIGRIEKAAKQYNKLTNSFHAGRGHRATVINAYEQGGLCFFEMGQKSSDSSLMEQGKEKLTIAVGLAASLASTLPELKNCAQEVWQSFRTLEKEIESESSDVNKSRELLKLLHLVRDHGRIVEVVKDILEKKEEELDDPEVIKHALESYLELRQYENALTFLRLASIRPAIVESEQWKNEMTELRVKVLLSTAYERLINKTSTTKDFFQQTFQLINGYCFGAVAEDDGTQTANSVVSDVLILHDDSNDTEKGKSNTTKVALTLQELFISVFGLDASRNLESYRNSGNEMEVWLEEIKQYQVILVILGIEEKDRMFEEVLGLIWTAKDPNASVYVMKTVKDSPVPLLLQNYPCLCLDNIIKLTGYIGRRDETLDPPDVIRHYFDDDITGVMKLFLFLIEKHDMKICGV